MKHHVWASKQLIVLVALTIAFAPAPKAAESSPRPPLDEKTRAIERAAALPELGHQSSGAGQQAATQPSPQPAPERELIKPPQVMYEDGQLTITAENSLLSEVMKALHAALGADIDLPAGVADQHIWVHLGPGPARRVLRDLLDGTEFNYMMQASDSDPDGIRSVLLTPRSKSTGPEAGAPSERAADRRILRPGPEAARSTEAENPPPEPVASVDPSQATVPASPANGLPTSAAEGSSQATVPASPANGLPTSAADGSSQSASLQDADSSAPKAASRTDQMIQQMQSMYEQRRQLQMRQNQKPAGQN